MYRQTLVFSASLLVMNTSTTTELEAQPSPRGAFKSTSALDLHAGGLYLSQPNHSVHTISRKSVNSPEELELAERAVGPSATTSSVHTADKEPEPARPAINPSSPSSKLRERIQFFSLCYSMFLLGWNDASQGPLIPRMQEVYHVRSNIQNA